MKKFMILSAMLMVVVLFVVVESPASGIISGGFNILISTNRPVISTPTTIAPGIYAAKPYAMTVVVPHSIDEKMVVGANLLSSIPRSKMPIATPGIRLEKR